MDAAHEAADDALDAFSERVRAIYSQAYGEAAALLEKHLEGYAEGVEDMRGRVERGEMTDDEFRRWRTGKALEGSRFQALCGQMAECVAHADELAREVVGGTLPDVYAENVLFAAYSIESQAGRLFTAVSADALQSLLRGDDLLPPLKDATEWARRHVSQAVTQGVLLGESVPRISKRLEDAVDMSRRAAVRTARTAVTSAENAGRKAACDRAVSMGARVTRRWMATLDGRTRDSHRALDGERVGEDGKFSNGLRFPGDPTGRPEEFYNCRCTTVPEVRGHDVFGDRWERLPEGTTYEEWKRGVVERTEAGAVRGALNDKNDPDMRKRDAHAKAYYEGVRKRDPEAEIAAIVKSSGVDEDTVRTARDHVFMLKHDLEKGYAYFDPDYDIAQSWQRLTSGVGVLPHDITLIRHEAYEAALMSEGVPYSEAHDATQLVYNYAKELKEWIRGGDDGLR